MKVVKFGGSSVASGRQIEKISKIILADEERKIVIVSAPGKRHDKDLKTTDLLISLAESVNGTDYDSERLDKVVDRYSEIVRDLSLDETLISQIRDELIKMIETCGSNKDRLFDALKGSGENCNAKVIAAYFQSLGVEASYVSPKEAGIIVTNEPGNAQILPEAYEKIAKLRDRSGILVIPGFFGYSKEGHMVTFPRGGSDITGSIVAAGVDAIEYENFTDVDCIYSVNPSLVKNPHEIKELTYGEMRELAYSGFAVFHSEALQPVVKKKIPVRIKNTNHPEAEGTRIVAERDIKDQQVIGVASDKGFCSINMTKYLMNREIGFGRHLLEILEDENISFEHTPSGIDSMSVILHYNQLDGEKEERVLNRIKDELQVDEVHIEPNLALVMIVGEGMAQAVGVAAKATEAFAKAEVSLKLINQGASELSIMFAVEEDKADIAVQSLYHAFFTPSKATIM